MLGEPPVNRRRAAGDDRGSDQPRLERREEAALFACPGRIDASRGQRLHRFQSLRGGRR
jgi:hypothetical protein